MVRGAAVVARCHLEHDADGLEILRGAWLRQVVRDGRRHGAAVGLLDIGHLRQWIDATAARQVYERVGAHAFVLIMEQRFDVSEASVERPPTQPSGP